MKRRHVPPHAVLMEAARLRRLDAEYPAAKGEGPSRRADASSKGRRVLLTIEHLGLLWTYHATKGWKSSRLEPKE